MESSLQLKGELGMCNVSGANSLFEIVLLGYIGYRAKEF